MARIVTQIKAAAPAVVDPPAKRTRVYVRKNAQVLAAAEKVFLQVGYELTSMDEVAKVAGVSKRTIYSNFDNKDELFAAVIRSRCEDILPDAKVIAKAREAEPEEALRLLSTTFLKSILSKPKIELYQTVIDASRHRPEMGRILIDGPVAGSHRMFSDYLREQVAKGRLSIPDIDRATGQLIGLLKADLHMLLLFAQPIKVTSRLLDQHVKSSIDLFLNGTTAKGPKSAARRHQKP